MSFEQSTAISRAQEFFLELHRELRGAPHESHQATEVRMATINEYLAALTFGGQQLEDGVVEAEYEAFVQPVHIVVEPDGTPLIVEQHDKLQTCRVQFAEEGVEVEKLGLPLHWMATFELEQRPTTSLLYTRDGELYRPWGSVGNPFQVGRSGAPLAIASSFAGVFNANVFIQRNY